jgi:hypothetical protein
MPRTLPVAALLFASHALASESYRAKPCKTPELASQCVHLHARLWQGNGTPSTRLWEIGSHHIYGIYSNLYGFSHNTSTLDNEAPELPREVKKRLPENGGWTVYGDFEVCPLESHRESHMQAACIESATNVFALKD